MSVVFYPPQYSFVKILATYLADGTRSLVNNDYLESPCPGNDMLWCLPIAKEDDLAFSIYVKATTTNEQSILCNLDLKTQVKLYLSKGVRADAPSLAEFGSLTPSWPLTGDKTFERVRLSTELFVFTWRWPLTNLFDSLEVGDCFQLAFLLRRSVAAGVVELRGISNCMIRVPDSDGYTTHIEYSSKGVFEMDFDYCTNTQFKNRVRLPMYPSRPKYKEDESVYVKSNGERKITSSITSKLHDFMVDYMPEWGHDCLMAALKHKQVIAQHPLFGLANYYKDGSLAGDKAEIRKEGEYDVEPIEPMGYPHYPAKFKAYQTPFILKKNVCASKCDNGHFPVAWLHQVLYDKCGHHDYSLSGIINIGCAGPITYEITSFNPLYVQSATMNNITKILHVDTTQNAVAGTVWLVEVKATHPLGEDYISVQGNYSGIAHC